MHRIIAAVFGLLALAVAPSQAGDLPSRYAPPPVINGGPGTKVGVLNCRLAPSIGLIVVSQKNGAPITVADVAKVREGCLPSFGQVGVNKNNDVVIGIVVGVGGNFLLGGSANTVALQPWSVEGTTGVNASLGLSNLQLRLAP